MVANQSEVASSDGFTIDTVVPTIILVTAPPSPFSIVDDVLIEYMVSEPIIDAKVNLTSAQGDPINYTSSIVDQNKIVVTLTAPFTSGDNYKIIITGVKDIANNLASSVEYSYDVGLLADFDKDGVISVIDFNNFIVGWQSKDMSYELAPINGTAPFFKPTMDGLFNLRDGMAFYQMWHWNHEGAGKLMTKVLSQTGQEANVSFDNNNLVFNSPIGARASEIIINYPATDIQISPRNEDKVDQLSVGLSKVDTLLGQMLTHQILNEEKSISFDLKHYTKNDVTITFSYQYIDKDNNVISGGSRDYVLKPVPEEFALHQNYPNPFNPITTIHYDLPEASHVNFVIYDILGRKVIDLVGQEVSAGYQTITWNGRNMMGNPVSAGIYFYQIQAKDFVKVRKMILLK